MWVALHSDNEKSAPPHFVNLPFRQTPKKTSGLYYKLFTIVIDAASVMLQIVASLMIVIDDAS